MVLDYVHSFRKLRFRRAITSSDLIRSLLLACVHDIRYFILRFFEYGTTNLKQARMGYNYGNVIQNLYENYKLCLFHALVVCLNLFVYCLSFIRLLS